MRKQTEPCDLRRLVLPRFRFGACTDTGGVYGTAPQHAYRILRVVAPSNTHLEASRITRECLT